MLRWISGVVAVAMLGACGAETEITADRPELLLIRDVNVVDTRLGRVVPNQSVYIEDSLITAVAPAADAGAPAGATVIDGSGKYLIPGLWDMHIHTSTEEVSRRAILPLLIANGVTGARSMAADCHIEDGGCDEPLPEIYVVDQWREEIAERRLVGPRIVASSYYTNGPASEAESSIDNPATEEHARAYARLLNERGVDLIKVYSGMYREAYFAMADEARKLDLEFSGHVPFLVRVSEASNAGQKSVEHITGFLEECSPEGDQYRDRLFAAYSNPREFWEILVHLAETFDTEKCEDLYAVLRANGTWHVPTLSVERFYDRLVSPRGDWRTDERMKYVPRFEAEYWDSMETGYFESIEDYRSVLQPHYYKSFEIVRAAHAAGVPMLAGSDPGDFGIIWGFSLHEELDYLVQAGLTPADALRAATLSPARYLGREDELGTVEQGRLADLVLLEENPLEDITATRTIDTVIANGRVFRREDLDEVLADIEAYVKESWARQDGDGE